MLKRRHLLIAISIFTMFFLVIVDLLTKNLAFAMHENIMYVMPILNIVIVKNFGITFGLLDDTSSLVKYGIIVFDISIIALLIYNLTKKENYNKQTIFVCSILSIISGAIGNLFDRIYYGYVRDFIDFHVFNYHWYIFNFADIYICIGTILLMICEIFFKKNQNENSWSRSSFK